MPLNVPPTAPPWQHLGMPKVSLAELKTTWALLHLLHHRSSNQHRRSSWYRHFSAFRRQLRKLLDELEPQVEAPRLVKRKKMGSGESEGVRRVRAYAEARGLLEQRVAFWVDNCVERWIGVFRQLVGDPQFGVLGLVLLACLGRVGRIMGLPGRMRVLDEEMGFPEAELGAQLESLEGRQVDGEAGFGVVGQEMEDFGRAVDRQVVDVDNGKAEAQRTSADEADKAVKRERPRKRRKKGDEIDSIFDRL